MSDEQEYATGGYVAPPGDGPRVQLGDGCCWILPQREPDGSMRIKVHRGELILRPAAVAALLGENTRPPLPPGWEYWSARDQGHGWLKEPNEQR